MEDKNNPGNGVVSNWTHENLRAQSNVDKGRYFTVCMVLLALYDYLHKKHIDAAAEVKAMQSLYSNRA